jgi:hypothetical protein
VHILFYPQQDFSKCRVSHHPHHMSYLFNLFPPEPIIIYTSDNTFVKFVKDNFAVAIGIITNANVAHQTVRLRHFMSLTELTCFVGEEVLRNFSLWPDLNSNRPLFLCDTDICNTIPMELVQDLAFVLHVSDPMLEQMQGMGNTYQVSSHICSRTKRM